MKPVFTQVDGELGCGLPVDISIEPAAVDLVMPKRGVKRFKRRQRTAGE